MTSVIPKPRDWDARQSSFSLLFSMPDNINRSKKLNAGVVVGSKAGLAGGVASVFLTPNTTFEEMIYTRKTWAALQVSKGFLVGALSGGMYVATMQQVSSLRGDKDDWVNHFAGAFGASIPYTILYKQTWRFFLQTGFLAGIAATIAKLGSQSEFLKKTYSIERSIPQRTKYPEVYLHYQVRKELREERRREKNLSE